MTYYVVKHNLLKGNRSSFTKQLILENEEKSKLV